VVVHDASTRPMQLVCESPAYRLENPALKQKNAALLIPLADEMRFDGTFNGR